jgi:hypothetical protein
MKQCYSCGEKKPEDKFTRSKRSKNGVTNMCKDCDNVRTKGRIFRSPETLLRRRFIDLRSRATRRKEKIGITPEDLIALYKKQHGLCALTSMPMTWANDGEHSNSAERRGTSISVDRIDPSIGYTKENIRLVCERANKVKGNMDDGELYFWCRQISYHLNSFPEED